MFVGDKARLVIPLGADFDGVEPLVLTKPESLPAATPELVIHRIELEYRSAPSAGPGSGFLAGGSSANGTKPGGPTGGARLLIDFTAFAVGNVPLPGIELPLTGGSGGKRVFSEGVTIPIASILTGDAFVLAPPAAPVPVPGTALLVYGTIGGFFLVLLFGIGARVWGWNRLQRWAAQFQRRRLVRLMERRLRTLRNVLPPPTPEGFTEGEFFFTEGKTTLAEGEKNFTEGKTSFTEGETTLAEGEKTFTEGKTSFTEGETTLAEEEKTLTDEETSFAEEEKTLADEEKTLTKREKILATVSGELRTFLTNFTGISCYALSAEEFTSLSSALETESAEGDVISGAFLCGLFRRCDMLRFSGTRISRTELLRILDEVQRFITALGQREQRR